MLVGPVFEKYCVPSKLYLSYQTRFVEVSLNQLSIESGGLLLFVHLLTIVRKYFFVLIRTKMRGYDRGEGFWM